MSRQLKFQAYDEQTGQMSEPFSLGDSWIRWLFSDGEQSQVVLVEELKAVRLTIRQFTGLLDKNGVEIYEGDVLSVCNGSINMVPWMDKPYAVKYVLNSGFQMPMFCWNKDGSSRMDSTHWCEVIGNIYQHPTLIEEKR